MIDDEIKYWVGLSWFKGLGWKKLELLMKHFGSAKKIWLAGPKLNPKWQNNQDLDQEMEKLEKALIRVITVQDESYPKLLKQISSPPILLYVKGRVEILNQPSLAVVGTRRASEYGRKAVNKLVPGLSYKLVIVSGLARGIDGWAHRVCLSSGGKTVAVLGHGLERIYPPENRPLAEEIVAKGGCLVSEFPFGSPMMPSNFPLRDRIIAGLALGTLVIEGSQKSGTKITAGFAADFGREVFCVPGPIDSPTAAGPAELIQQGAKLVTKVEDVLEELNLPKV